MESMTLVPISDGVSDEAEGDKTGDEAAIVTSGDNVADTKDDNGVPSGDKAREIATGGEAVAVATDNETVKVGVEDKLVGVLAGGEQCDDRRLMVTGCGPSGFELLNSRLSVRYFSLWTDRAMLMKYRNVHIRCVISRVTKRRDIQTGYRQAMERAVYSGVLLPDNSVCFMGSDELCVLKDRRVIDGRRKYMSTLECHFLIMSARLKRQDKLRIFEAEKAMKDIEKKAKEVRKTVKRRIFENEEDPDDPAYGYGAH
ncbi:hypothetical protein J6590_061488 [Homalodisca vitripennis]|nr:hypothetical protein J6590_061488 [Homalodisca vitripennis]